MDADLLPHADRGNRLDVVVENSHEDKQEYDQHDSKSARAYDFEVSREQASNEDGAKIGDYGRDQATEAKNHDQ